MFIVILLIFDFKIKEVAPIVSRDQRQFWKHDVKIARNFQGKSRNGSVGGENASISQQLADDFADFQGSDAGRLGQNAEILRNIGRSTYQHTWSPMNLHTHLHPNDARVTRDEMEHMYLNMAHPLNINSKFKRHYTMSGTGSSKTVAYRRPSPPKYRSLIHDQIFAANAQPRRSSLTQYTASPPIGTQGRYTTRSDESRLGNIREINSISSIVNETSQAIDRRSSIASSRRKFIVTPAPEDALKK